MSCQKSIELFAGDWYFFQCCAKNWQFNNMVEKFEVKSIPIFNCLALSFTTKFSNEKDIIQQRKNQGVYKPGRSNFCHYNRFTNVSRYRKHDSLVVLYLFDISASKWTFPKFWNSFTYLHAAKWWKRLHNSFLTTLPLH